MKCRTEKTINFSDTGYYRLKKKYEKIFEKT